MAIGDTDAQIAAKQQSEAINKLSSSMVGSSGSDADKKQVLVKRRPRGNLYGKHLWGSNPKDSGDLDYVRKHGEELIHKVLTEDDHWKYVSLKQVHDVRLYTPVATPEDDHSHASSAAAATATGTPASTRSLSSTSSSSTKERQSATRSLPGRCDFRAMTRLPGSIDTVMEILAADEDREAYWTAINTQKGLRANNMFGSRRLNSDAPFPRWSQRYMATRFTKYSTKSVDFCFAEYSKFAPVTKEGEPRRGFVYRRSVDESLFEMDAIKARMAKYDDECERMYIQDWLYEVSETQERDVCKVVLTCQVYFSGDYSRSLRTEFHEFTTDIMVQLRKVLTKHWREQQGEAVDEPESLGDAATKLLNNAFKIVKPGQSRYCAVCSSTFTLLRKRYTCRTCCVSMCSKCSKTSPHKGVATSGHGSHDKHTSNKECILCYQFSDETTDSRSSSGGGIGGSTRRRHFVTSSMSSEYDDDSDDNSSLTSSSRSILGNEYYTRKFNASKDLKSHTTAASPATTTATTTTTTTTAAAAAAHAKTPPRVVRKVRNDSSDSTASSKSVPEAGVVLFSDLDALTLSGRVRGTRPTTTASANGKRPVRTVSEDNVLHAKDSIKEEASEFDDLDNFTLKFKYLFRTLLWSRMELFKAFFVFALLQSKSLNLQSTAPGSRRFDHLSELFVHAVVAVAAATPVPNMPMDGALRSNVMVHQRSTAASSVSTGGMRGARRTLKDPRISNTSPQDVRVELEALEQVEFSQQEWWSLRFTNSVLEKRFQLYHEELSLKSSRVGCGCTLLGLVVMQSGAFYDLLVVMHREIRDEMDTTRWTLVYFGILLTVLLGIGWTCFHFKTRKSIANTDSLLRGRFQSVLFVLGVCVVLVVLAQPAYSPSLPLDTNSRLVDRTRRSHLLTKMILFLLMALSAIATVWNAQFLMYAAIASFAFVVLGSWLASYSFYLQQDWHVVLLFLCSLVMLGRALYRNERNLRLKFLRLRHLMLENIKLTQQNTFMQQQLSSHVDAIGIHHDDDHSHFRGGGDYVDANHHHNTNGPAGGIGESWMENVLKVLYQMKLQLGGSSDEISRDLDFVMQTLTSEQDLFMENRMMRRWRQTQSQVDAETGWLSLIEEQRHRRRKSCDLGVVVNVPVVKTIRRTDSGLRQTVLKQVENYLLAGQRHAAISPNLLEKQKQKKSPLGHQLSSSSLLSTDKWTSKKLLARAARSEEFDLLGFANVCMFPLTSIFLTTLESHNLFVELPVRVECAAEYGLEIESRYQAKNPYHNAVHAASVVWDINFFLRRLQQTVTPLQVFSALIAGAVHDVNHPGMNNAYLVNTSSPLAIKYSDDSVLERMHLAEAFQASSKDGCDVFEGFPKELKRQSRQMIIKMVLATDLSGHLKHVSRLKSKRYVVHSTSSSDLMAPQSPSNCSSSSSSSYSVLPDDLVFHSIIMMADLGHAMKSFDAHFAWSKLVTEEFFRQGDTERQFNMPISPLCDRSNSKFERNQIGFLEFVVLPLYSAVKEVLVLADFDSVIERIQQNTAVWRHKAELAEQPQPQQHETVPFKPEAAEAPMAAAIPIVSTPSPPSPPLRAVQRVIKELSLEEGDEAAIDMED